MTPLALFVFNRPKYAQKALSTLARCTRIDECDVHIFCDGARNSKDEVLVEETRRVVKHWSNVHEATTIFRSENLGLAQSIFSGVSEMCARYGKVIVLEDDMIVSPDFLNYMLGALTKYEDCKQVLQVSGYMFDLEDAIEKETFFLPLSTTRGWATWQRAWNNFDLSTQGALEIISDESIRVQFDLDGSYPFSKMLEKSVEGTIDSWGILWWKTVFQSNGLVLYPARSLVWVGGFDGSGTHTRSSDRIRQPVRSTFRYPKLNLPIQWPIEVEADLILLDRVKSHLNSMKLANSRRAWPRKMLKKIGLRFYGIRRIGLA